MTKNKPALFEALKEGINEMNEAEGKNKTAEEIIRTEIVESISEMLDNPGECEIYPTTKCYDRLVKYFVNREAHYRKAIVEEILAALPEDKNMDYLPSNYGTKTRYEDEGYNQALSEVRVIVEGMV